MEDKVGLTLGMLKSQKTGQKDGGRAFLFCSDEVV
ncbi:Uncharacterised protein [Streptococcus pyogenes]|nr:Uncharacterised protein [Streptococcus pyogenes]